MPRNVVIKADHPELVQFFKHLDEHGYPGGVADYMLSYALDCSWRTVQRARLGDTAAEGFLNRVRAALAVGGVLAEALFQPGSSQDPSIAYGIAVLRRLAEDEGWKPGMVLRSEEG